MDISKMTVVELKALAYDELAKIEIAQANLRTVNEAIKGKADEPTEAIGDLGSTEGEVEVPEQVA